MRKTVVLFLSILILLCIISCSSEGVVDDAFKVTVTFNGNGAKSGSMVPQRIGRGVETMLKANEYEWPCHNFTGWNTACDGSGTAYTDGQSINTKENITLYAQWELDTVVLTSSTYPWTDGKAYILNSDVTIGSWVDVTGNVILILTDGNTLTASKGIFVYDGAALTIDAQGEGTGVLIATGSGQAGIGGFGSENCGTVIINGGVITASGGSGAAGIGGGDEGNFGEITINGGIVTASGGQNSAGIGNGWHGSGGTVTINGGTVNATGNGGGAGIGRGEWGDGGERIIINDGNVTASGGTGAAGIGGGGYGDGGEITINGGTVTASGGTGAVGIGKGTGGTDDGKLNLGEGVSLVVRWSYSPYWSDYDGTNRRQYMKTVQ